MTAKRFIENGIRIQAVEGNKSIQAIPEYLKAIEACNDQADGYALLYAHYQIMWISSHSSPQQSVQYAEKCLDLLKPVIQSGAIGHFTEMGRFYEEVIRYSTNCIAWNGFNKTDDTAELERLLDLVSMGCRYADAPEYFYVIDTKVRILLKMGRKEEAFGLVSNYLKKDHRFADFNDIIKGNDYILWKSNSEAGVLEELTAEEKSLLQKAARITQQIQQRITGDGAVKKILAEQIPQKEIITLGEARERYQLPNYHGNDDAVLLIRGDLQTKGPVNDAWIAALTEGMRWNNRLFGVIVDGHLTIDGDIIDDQSIELFVIGDLACDYIFSCNGIIEIRGKADVKFGIYGEYNDGSLDIYGKLTTPYLLSYDHSMPREAEGEFIFIDGGNGTDRESIAIRDSKNSQDDYEDSHRFFVPEVWDDKNEFSIEDFFKIVKEGKNPFIKI